MKANRKFLRGDEAVSPVIAVILMVAITVVLAATVYVWVSGFGSQSGTPAKSLSLTTNGSESCSQTAGADTPLDNADDAYTCTKRYVVASATNGMKYGDMSFTLNGAPYAFDAVAADADNEWSVMRGTTAQTATSAVQAGDVITLFSRDSPALGVGGTQADATQVGAQLRILDAQANSIILTLTVT